MCGVAGIFAPTKDHQIDQHRFSCSVAEMQHRGPNTLIVSKIREHLILGHARLAILDLDERSNQPMSLGGRYWITYNGEIYNYSELKRELEANGSRFLTTGDTEVILHAYALWGKECVSHFNGMWAFAIYDTVENSLFCSRDRFGEKPFYYSFINGEFIFASEINALLTYRTELREPDFNVIANFCRTSVGAQHAITWFKRISRLQPGHNLIVDVSGIKTERYWQYPTSEQRSVSFAAACEQYRALFLDAVSLRMRSDVPIGITLSAGLDSASIAYAMHSAGSAPFHSFTASFKPSGDLIAGSDIYANGAVGIDEADGAKKLSDALGFHSHIVPTSYSDFVPSLSRIVSHLGSGNSSPAVIPLFQLLEEARKYVTVILEGQGADELLAGYVVNALTPATLELAAKGNLAAALLGLREFSRTYKLGYALKLALRDMSNDLHAISDAQQSMSGIDRVYGPALRSFSRLRDFPTLPEPESMSRLSRSLRRQHSGGLVNLLHYGDSISMAHSLESRLPFTDHRLVEFVWTLPADFKLRAGVGKYIHREAMRGLVPNHILDAKLKLGFATPIRTQFLRQPRKDEDPVDVLLSKRCIERGIFDEQGLRKIIERHVAGQHDFSPLLFRLLSVELWFRTFIDVGHSTKPKSGTLDTH